MVRNQCFCYSYEGRSAYNLNNKMKKHLNHNNCECIFEMKSVETSSIIVGMDHAKPGTGKIIN